jgi:predicted RNA-binding protein
MKNIDNEFVRGLAFVLASEKRYKILIELSSSVTTPSRLAKKFDYGYSDISNLLRQLRTYNLTACLNPDAKKGRLYTITDMGNRICKFLNSDNLYKENKGNKMANWLYVTTIENWNIIQNVNLIGLPKWRMNTINEVNKKDNLVIFIKKGFKNPSSIVAIYKALSKPYEDITPLFYPTNSNYIFPIRIKVEVVKMFKTPIVFNDVIQELEFIKNKTNWGGHLQGKSLIRLSDADYSLLKNFD